MLLASSQKGVALITALLIVALATVISVTLSTRIQLDIRRTGNLIASDQALAYMMEAEFWSRRILKEDQSKNNYDHLGEDWAMEIPPLPVEGGTIQGKLNDLHACFNLNSLYQGNAVNTLARDRFTRLMQGLPTPPRTDLSQAIIDWIDADLTTTVPDGAEDDYYLNLEKPYRSANQPIKSISELRLIKGFEEDQLIQDTKNLLCGFEASTSINVNTAPVEVLESLAAGITTAMANDIVINRQNTPYETMNDFLTTNNLSTIITDTAGLSVSSEYFLLEVVANIGQARTLLYSIIHRDNHGITEVVARSQGAY